MDPIFISGRNTFREFAEGCDFVSDLRTNIFTCKVAMIIGTEAKTLFTYNDF